MIVLNSVRKSFVLLLVVLSVVACGNNKKKNPQAGKPNKALQSQKPQKVEVEVVELKQQTFNQQTVCNGKLRAFNKGELNFEGQGVIAKIEVKNGDFVKKGEIIAVLDTEDAMIALAKSKQAMQKADIDLIDKLIGQGYDRDTTKVPADVMSNVKLASGYNTSLDQLKEAERALADCYLKAPFSGRVANLNAKVFGRSGDALCTLIDDNLFDVEFNLLEAEYDNVKRGQKVTVSPFINSEKQFEGKVTEVNPIIDDKGQVMVRAEVENRNGYLLEGMNVKLVLEREVPGCFVVPRDAVIIKDGYNVVFKYVNGKAVMTNVDVVMSNIDSHVITGDAEKGTTILENDIIITKNNLNLNNNNAVKVVKGDA